MTIPRSIDTYSRYMSTFMDVVGGAAATDGRGRRVPIDTAIKKFGSEMRACTDRGRRILLVGNGGSAGICSHLATDLSKNGRMRATAFNDGAVLTCLANDYGYEHVFSKQVEWHATAGDLLVAISSSGKSVNILNAVKAARAAQCGVFTMSGFDPDNPLRAMGDLNIYLSSQEYGFVEVGHLAVLHAALDMQMGWGRNTERSAVLSSSTAA